MHTVLNTYRPKLIVWQLTADQSHSQFSSQQDNVSDIRHEPFSTHECLLTVDSIARLARPIVVLTGPSLLQRRDLFAIVEYAVALGLKMILEVHPDELTDDIVRKFSQFGPRIFRILVDDCIVEDIDERYKRSDHFQALEQAVQRLRDAGLEIHLGATIRMPDVRQLAFDHDYAIRRSAAGFYCHFCFDPEMNSRIQSHSLALEADALIDGIAQMKSFSPKDMYFSPQCVRYGHRGSHTLEYGGNFHTEYQSHLPSEWIHWCLGGKTFAFIDADGTVHICACIQRKCGDLRGNGYDLTQIWENSEVLRTVRDNNWSCTETREQLLPHREPETIESQL